jgi:23S rRNA (adenine2503-C2)-methyltransferase
MPSRLTRRRYGETVNLELLDAALAGQPTYRARQVWEWTARGAGSYAEMTNLPAGLRAVLEERVPFSSSRSSRRSPATARSRPLRDTRRAPVEAVLMRYRDGRRSVRVSSQSGCPLTCTFCATGQMRFGRNGPRGEILDQALHFRRIEPIDHRLHGDGRADDEPRPGARRRKPCRPSG